MDSREEQNLMIHTNHESPESDNETIAVTNDIYENKQKKKTNPCQQPPQPPQNLLLYCV